MRFAGKSLFASLLLAFPGLGYAAPGALRKEAVFTALRGHILGRASLAGKYGK